MGKGSRNRKDRQEHPEVWQPSSKERKLMDELIWQEILKLDEKWSLELEAAYLYVLHMKHGWGEKRLHEFFDEIDSIHYELRKHYEIAPKEGIAWLYTDLMSEMGYDIHDWYKNKQNYTK